MPRDGRDEHGGIYDRDFDDPDLIGSADPAAPPEIRANYLQHDHDREISIKLVRFVRELLSRPALTALAEEETAPGGAGDERWGYRRCLRARGWAVPACVEHLSHGTGPDAGVDPATMRVYGT